MLRIPPLGLVRTSLLILVVIGAQLGQQVRSQSQLENDALEWAISATDWYMNEWWPLYGDILEAVRDHGRGQVVEAESLVPDFARRYIPVAESYFAHMGRYYGGDGRLARQLNNALSADRNNHRLNYIMQAANAAAQRNMIAFEFLSVVRDGGASATEVRLLVHIVQLNENLRQVWFDRYFRD